MLGDVDVSKVWALAISRSPDKLVSDKRQAEYGASPCHDGGSVVVGGLAVKIFIWWRQCYKSN